MRGFPTSFCLKGVGGCGVELCSGGSHLPGYRDFSLFSFFFYAKTFLRLLKTFRFQTFCAEYFQKNLFIEFRFKDL
jgi:hypothetical protein